ncbi:MAG: hypothetical protein R3E14_01105 [Erythrobacter sp.]
MKSGAKIFLTVILAVGVVTPVLGASSEEEQFEQIVKDSNSCLNREVNSRISDDQIELNDEQRSAVRMAAASACHGYDRQLAPFTDVVIVGKKTVDEVSEKLLVNSLSIADAMITMRLKSNKGHAY